MLSSSQSSVEGTILVNAFPEHCEARQNEGLSVESWSFFQRAMTKSKPAKVYSLLQEYKPEHNLLQEKHILSKTKAVWDEDDQPTSGHADIVQVDPIESVLESFDVPVTIDNGQWPMVGAANPLLYGQKSQFIGSTMLPEPQRSTNASLETDRAPSSVPPVLTLTKDNAVLLSDLQTPVELTSQPPEVVDPPSSLLQEVPLERLDRIPIGGQRRDFLWPFGKLPRYGFYTALCIVALVGVMMLAACQRSSTVQKSKNLAEEEVEEEETIKSLYEEAHDTWVQVEVIGKLKNDNLLLRRQSDNKLLIISPASPNLRPLPKKLDSTSKAGPACVFPKLTPYDPNRAPTFMDLYQTLHWHLKATHEHLVDIAGRGMARHQPKHLHKSQKNDDELDDSDAQHVSKAEAETTFADEVEEDLALVYLAVEDLAGDALQDVEDVAAEQLHRVVGAAMHVSKNFEKFAGNHKGGVTEAKRKTAKALHTVKEKLKKFRGKKDPKRVLAELEAMAADLEALERHGHGHGHGHGHAPSRPRSH